MLQELASLVSGYLNQILFNPKFQPQTSQPPGVEKSGFEMLCNLYGM